MCRFLMFVLVGIIILPMNMNSVSLADEFENHIMATTEQNNLQVRQINAAVWMCSFVDDIYMYMNTGFGLNKKNIGRLVSLGKKEVVYTFPSSAKPLGYLDGRLYYTCIISGLDRSDLVVLDLRSMHLNTIKSEYSIEYEPGCATVYSFPDSICIPLDKNSKGFHYAVVSGDTILRYTDEAMMATDGTIEVFLSSPDSMLGNINGIILEEVIIKKSDGATKTLSREGKSIPVAVFEIGGCVVLYCDRGNNLLSIITSDMHVEPFFSVECLESKSSLAIHDHTIFLSLRRYLEWGPGYLSYATPVDDEVEGLYAIDVPDMTIRKISDSFYTGLYNLDDQCLYGCDIKGNVYQIGFDGSAVLVYAQPK